MKSQEITNTALQDIIRKIRSEGIEEADKKAEEILNDARQTASEIISKARQDAEAMINQAGEEIKKKECVSKKSLEQAARDIILSIRASLTEIFDSIIKKEYRDALSGNTLEKILLKLIEGWQRNNEDEPDIEVILNESDRDVLLEGFLSKLTDEMKAGIELKVHPDIEGGFRIGMKGGNVYYDFTDEGITALLSEYLNPAFHNYIDSLKKDRK